MRWATACMMSSSRGGALRHPGSTRWSSTRSPSRSDVHQIPIALAGNGFRVRAFGRHRSSAESYRIDDVLDSQQLCAYGRNDRTNWVMPTKAAHCAPPYEGSRAQATVKGKFFATRIDVRSTNQSCCKAVFTANSRSSVTLRDRIPRTKFGRMHGESNSESLSNILR